MSIKITDDRETDSRYIATGINGQIVRTDKKKDWLLFDYNGKDKIVGIEILNASQHPITVHVINDDVFCLPPVQQANFIRFGKDMLSQSTSKVIPMPQSTLVKA